MSVFAAVLVAAAVCVLLSRPAPTRLAAAVRAPQRGSPRAATTSGIPLPQVACAVGGLGVFVLVGGLVGALLGLAVAVAGPRLLGRLESAAVRQEREQLLRDLPLVLDLLSSCLTGGAPLPAAAEAVARAVGGPAGRRLAGVSAALAVGAPPGEAWTALAGTAAAADAAGDADDPLAPAARALSRAAEGGAPVASAVGRLAAEARADTRGRAEEAARRVGVLAVAPLGLCFLPAFVLLGVVPVIIGMAGPLLDSL